MKSSPKENSDILRQPVTRRDLPRLLALLAVLGVAMVPEVSSAQDSRGYIDEAGRQINMFSGAERIMKEWGITLNGSQIAGPSDILHSESSKKFPGICLTDRAIRVDIHYFAGASASLVFEIIKNHGSDEGVAFLPIQPNIRDTKKYMTTTNPVGFTEGSCAPEIG